MTERTFTIIDAAAVSGLSRHSISKMISLGQFRPLCGTHRGTCRPYTLRDIVHLAAVSDLHAAGISLCRTVEFLGASAEGTAGRENVIHRYGETEIVQDIAAITARVLDDLGLARS